MIRYLCCFLFLLVPMLASGQQFVKVNILDYYDKVPAPPADAKEAYSKAECAGEDVMKYCAVAKLYQSISDSSVQSHQGSNYADGGRVIDWLEYLRGLARSIRSQRARITGMINTTATAAPKVR